MTLDKPIIKSRTHWALLLAILAPVAGHIVPGLDATVLELENLADGGGVTVSELLQVVAVIAAAYFRTVAQHALRGLY